MRKWLVGLAAAGLCAASAWATTDTLTAANFTATSTTYTEFSNVTTDSGSGAVFAGKTSKSGDGAIQLRTTGSDCGIVTTGSGGTATKVTIAWNAATTNGARTVDVYGNNTAYSAASDLYSKDTQGTKLGSLNKGNGDTELVIEGEYAFIGLRSSSSALHLDSVAIEWSGEAPPKEFTVSLALSGGSEIEQNAEAKVTATPKNAAEGDVSYSWTVGGTPVDATGAVLTLDTSAVTDEPVEVVCKATDADGAEATASVSYTVVVPAVKYAVNVADTITGGEISADKETAKEGETVTLTASPAVGYKFLFFTVDGLDTTSNTFVMPAKDVFVTATFAEKPPVTGDVLTRETTGVTGTSYKDWTATGESGTEYAGNSAGGNTSIQLNTGSPKGIVITKSAGKDVASVTVEWNENTADKRSIEIYGSTTAYAGPADLYGDDKGELLGEIAKGDTTLEVPAGYPYIGILAKGGALYLTSVAIDFGGTAAFSITLDPAKDFEVEVGAEATIKATPKNAEGEVRYAWTIGGTPVDATGDVLTLDTSVPTDTLEVVCTAKDGADAEATAKVSYKVVAPAPKFAVNVAIGILHGGVLADKTEAEEGEEVTLTAQPASGYKLGTFLVDSEAIPGNKFNMPGHDVLVSATFVEVTGETYTLVESAADFEEGAEYLIVAYSKDKFTSALKNEASGTRIGVEEVVIAEDNTVTTDSDAIVWTIKAGAAEGQYVLCNEAKGVYAAATKDDNVAQLLDDETATLAQWTIKLDDLPKAGIWSVSYPERWLSRNSTAANAYFATYKGSGTAPYLFKKAGPSAPKIVFDGETTKKVGETFSLQFTLNNFDGEYTWEKQSREDGSSIDENGLWTWAPTEAYPDGIDISVAAVADGKSIATKTVTLIVEEGDVPPPPSATLTCEPSEVTMAVGGSATVTVTLKEGDTVVDLGNNYIYFEAHVEAWSDENPATFDLAALELEAGTHELAIVAGIFGDVELARTTLTVNVGEGPGPQPGEQPVIRTIDIVGSEVTLTFTGDGSAVQGTDNLTANDWADVSGAIFGEGSVTVPKGKHYLRIRQ